MHENNPFHCKQCPQIQIFVEMLRGHKFTKPSMKPPCWCSSVVHLPCETEIPLFCFCWTRDENCLQLFDFLLRMRELCQHVVCAVLCHQPRSQALSPLSLFVVGRETLFAADHITTQTLGGKKKNLLGGKTKMQKTFIHREIQQSNRTQNC